MAAIIVDIPKKIMPFVLEKKGINSTKEEKISLEDLFAKFGLDLDFLIQETKYAQKYVHDIKKKHYVVSNTF